MDEIMRNVLISIIIIGVIIIVILVRKTHNIDKKREQQNIQKYVPGTINYLPCTYKQLLTPDERNFYMQLRRVCNPEIIQIFPKVKLDNFIQVTNDIKDYYTQKNMSYLPCLEADFVLTDINLNIIAVIELEVSNDKQLPIDIIKSAGIALHTIELKNDYTKDINKLLDLYMPIIMQSRQQ